MTDIRSPTERPGVTEVDNDGNFVCNVINDSAEIDCRKLSLVHQGTNTNPHMIVRGDLLFARKGKHYNNNHKHNLPISEYPVFANFDGICETSDQRDKTEHELVFVGVARNQPKHQGHEGRERGQRFAAFRFGKMSIRANCLSVIPPHALLMWEAPVLAPNQSNDRLGAGRKMPTIRVFNPKKDGLDRLKIHETVRRTQSKGGLGLGKHHEKTKAAHADLQLFESLCAVVYSGVIAYTEHTRQTEMSDEEKMALAELFNLVDNQTNTKMANSLKFRNRLADSLFNAKFDEVTRSSHSTDEHYAFPAGRYNARHKDKREPKIAAKQARQMDNVMMAVVEKHMQAKERVFAKSLRSAEPDSDIDVLLLN